MKKQCCSCKKHQELSEFFKDKTKLLGVGSECKECRRKRGRIFYAKNKKIIKEKRKQYYLLHKEQFAAYHKKHNSTPEEKKRAYKRAMKHQNKKLEWFLAYLGTNRLHCNICKYDKSFAAIQMHHINPAEKENSKDNFSRWLRIMSIENFQKKILNTSFDILCANCHAEIHSGKEGYK